MWPLPIPCLKCPPQPHGWLSPDPDCCRQARLSSRRVLKELEQGCSRVWWSSLPPAFVSLFFPPGFSNLDASAITRAANRKSWLTINRTAPPMTGVGQGRQEIREQTVVLVVEAAALELLRGPTPQITRSCLVNLFHPSVSQIILCW